ncbi:DUF488 domain-containing protein [Metabacillus niabensis]|uniref:DUF488 domain-containing protein n=1 Tax=Metabacillus niabensis TaxID=324854 RepID=UPI0039A296B7
MINLKRAYEKPSKEDGMRILVDRIWPRGISKQDLQIDKWWKEVAPTTELRKWFQHDPGKFTEFKVKYMEELKSEGTQKASLKELKKFVIEQKSRPITFIYAAKNQEYNHAIILKEIVEMED